MNVLGGVVVYGDDFGAVKAVSTLLCIWFVKTRKEKDGINTIGDDHHQLQVEMPEIVAH